MELIEQSQVIMQDNPISGLLEQVEERGRICYKSEAKIDIGTAEKFCKFAINKKHQTVLEMGVISVLCDTPVVLGTHTKFLTVDHLAFDDAPTTLITATVRGWREWMAGTDEVASAAMFHDFLNANFPVLFGDMTIESDVPSSPAEADLLSLFDVEELRDEVPNVYKLHKFQAVKFITNRAVSHELVRHRQQLLQESQRYCRYDKGDSGVVFIKPTAFFEEGSDAWCIWEQGAKDSEDKYLALLAIEGTTPQAARTALINSCKTEVILYMSLKMWEHFFCLRTSKAAEPSMREAVIPVYEHFNTEMYPGMFELCETSLAGS